MNILPVLSPWDQQPGESSRQFEAFIAYRDLGARRTIRDAIKLVTGKENTKARFDVWSVQNKWVLRAEAYDCYMDQVYTSKKAEEVKEMAERHSKMAVVFLNKVISRLQNVEPDSLTHDQLLRWFEVAARIERLSRGESTSHVRNEHFGNIDTKVDLSKLSEDDFDTVHSIVIRAINNKQLTAGSCEEEGGEPDQVCP